MNCLKKITTLLSFFVFVLFLASFSFGQEYYYWYSKTSNDKGWFVYKHIAPIDKSGNIDRSKSKQIGQDGSFRRKDGEMSSIGKKRGIEHFRFDYNWGNEKIYSPKPAKIRDVELFFGKLSEGEKKKAKLHEKGVKTYRADEFTDYNKQEIQTYKKIWIAGKTPLRLYPSNDSSVQQTLPKRTPALLVKITTRGWAEVKLGSHINESSYYIPPNRWKDR